MDGRALGEHIAKAFMAMILAAVAVGAGVTVALIYGLPWLWSMVKPWLHGVTG